MKDELRFRFFPVMIIGLDWVTKFSSKLIQLLLRMKTPCAKLNENEFSFFINLAKGCYQIPADARISQTQLEQVYIQLIEYRDMG
jgi:hypothetical protein